MKIVRILSVVPLLVFSILWWILLFRSPQDAVFGRPAAEVLSFVRAAWLACAAAACVVNGIVSWNAPKKWWRWAFLGMALVFIALFALRLAGIA